MSEQKFEKDFGPIDSARERTGIYGLGFDLASMMGFMVPVIISGGAIVAAALIYFYL